MAKELPSANTKFELSEDFWKKYKPDSVKETGLSAALRDHARVAKEAEKLEAGNGTPVEKMNKWGQVLSSLHDLTAAMPKVIAMLAKEKDSHKNLKASLQRVHKELKGKNHAEYVHAEERKEHWYDLALPPPAPEEGANMSWMDKLPKNDTRNWKTVPSEYYEHAEGMPEDNEFEAVLGELRKISRSGWLTRMTGPKSFDSDTTRIITQLTDAQNKFNAFRSRHDPEINQRPDLRAWLDSLAGHIRAEKVFWTTIKANRPHM